MRLSRLLRKGHGSSQEGDATPHPPAEPRPIAARGLPSRAAPVETPAGKSAPSAARLDELRAQAQFARQRYDLYKARSYGPRLTSPARLRELKRECERAEANFRFARAETKAADEANAAARRQAD
jgi:hypothetical protein